MLQHKGQGFVLEGNMAGERIANDKCSYDSMGNLEYAASCKYGTEDMHIKHYIERLVWDSVGNFIRKEVATNRRVVGATDVTVDLSTTQAVISGTGADFTEVQNGDIIFINTPANTNISVKIHEKIDSSSVRIGVEDSTNLTAEVGTIISAEDLILSLENPSNKDFDKRRWDIRELYIYA